ncbi:MAG TPA: mechanosensitive ion channel family protein [Pyrinomonadaceae bacterium]
MNFFVFLILQTMTPASTGKAPAPVGSGIWQNIAHRISIALPYLAISVAVFVASLLIARLSGRAVKALLPRIRVDANLASLLGGFTSIVITLMGVIAAVLVLFPTFDPLEVLAALAAVSVAISFVFKDVVDSFLSGIMILWRKPYVIGDEIKVLKYEGTVIGFTFRSTLIKTYQNELVFISNSHIYASELVVRTAFESRIVQLQVGIGYSDDIELGRKTIETAALEAEGVIAEPAPMAFVTEFGDSALNFTVYFHVEPKHLNIVAVSDRVATNIKYALDQAGIDMPYPTTVVHLQDTEEQSTESGERNTRADRRGAIRSDSDPLPRY